MIGPRFDNVPLPGCEELEGEEKGNEGSPKRERAVPGVWWEKAGAREIGLSSLAVDIDIGIGTRERRDSEGGTLENKLSEERRFVGA